jgi:molybdopterin-containing oxidoreductase family membrane subunit
MGVTDATITRRPGTVRFIGIDWDFGSLVHAGRLYWLWVGLLGVFLLLGAFAWSQILTQGGAVVAMRDGYPWGLWFTNYMYFVGLSAGGLVVYASVHLFGAKQYAPLSRLAVLQAGVLVMMALLGIVTDMERPWRAVWMLLTPNATSPFVYTGSAANIYMIICFIDLWVLISRKGGEKLAMTMTLIALPFAIYLHTTTAFVLSLNKSRELWNAAVMVPIFLTSATASGIALLFIFAYLMQALTRIRFKASMFRSLATLLATVIILDLFLLLVEMLTIFWPTSSMPGHAIRMSEFLWGSYAWAFLPVVFLGLTAFALLAGRKRRGKPWVQLTAAIMYVIAIFLKRYVLMAMGFVRNPLGQLTGIYVPSPVEIFLALGIVAFGLLFVTVAVKVLPMEVPDEGHGEAEAPAMAPAPAPVSAVPVPVTPAPVAAAPVTEVTSL